jgi:hypothetical protein
MGAVGRVRPAGVTLQFAIALSGARLWGPQRELDLAHRRSRGPPLLSRFRARRAAESTLSKLRHSCRGRRDSTGGAARNDL